jgi:cystathionine beta-lyase
VRAPIVASWLRQLGHDATGLRDGLASGVSLPVVPPFVQSALMETGVAALADALVDGRTQTVDLRPSMSFRAGHVSGSR